MYWCETCLSVSCQLARIFARAISAKVTDMSQSVIAGQSLSPASLVAAMSTSFSPSSSSEPQDESTVAMARHNLTAEQLKARKQLERELTSLPWETKAPSSGDDDDDDEPDDALNEDDASNMVGGSVLNTQSKTIDSDAVNPDEETDKPGGSLVEASDRLLKCPDSRDKAISESNETGESSLKTEPVNPSSCDPKSDVSSSLASAVIAKSTASSALGNSDDIKYEEVIADEQTPAVVSKDSLAIDSSSIKPSDGDTDLATDPAEKKLTSSISVVTKSPSEECDFYTMYASPSESTHDSLSSLTESHPLQAQNAETLEDALDTEDDVEASAAAQGTAASTDVL